VEWCVHARVTTHRSWCWGGELRGLGWGFYRREREDGGMGLLLGKVRPGGKTMGAAASLLPAGPAVAQATPAAGNYRCVEAS
jgi:hypothetical protein